MMRLSNSHSLTEFQRNAKGFLAELNATGEPLLLTVNGSVQAVLVDPDHYQQMERERLIAAIREGEADIAAGRTRPSTEVFANLREKFGLQD